MLFQFSLKVLLLSLKYLSILITIWFLSSVSDRLLSFSSYWEFFHSFRLGVLCLTILGDLFLLASVSYGALTCPPSCGEVHGGSYVGLNGPVHLISLSGSSRVALSWVHLLGLSCASVFPHGGSFFGGFSPPAGFLGVTVLSCLLLYKCWLIKKYCQTTKSIPAKRTPHCISNLIHNLRKINKCEKRL